MKLILRTLLSAIAVVILSNVLPNVYTNNFITAIFVAIAISLLNLLVRPILVILTLPVTILTLGLFLLVVNAIIIYLADYFVDGFTVNGIGWAMLFSLLLSFLQWVLHSLLKDK